MSSRRLTTFALSCGLLLGLAASGVAAAQTLARLEYRVVGTELRVTPAALAVPKNIPGSVLVEIIAGEDGVRYFTLRQQWDPGAKYMPQSRGKLQKGNQRTRIKANIPVFSDGERAERQTVRVENIFESEPDGLSAGIYYLSEGDSHTLPSPSSTGGQYLVVASGVMIYDGKSFDRWSTIYVAPDEEAFEVRAGSEGLDILLLEFPRL